MLICLVILTPVAKAQTASGDSGNTGTGNLVLMHPTVSNLKVMVNLVRNDLVSLDGFRLVGVYHKHERYDYSRSERYLDTLSYEGPEIYLREMTDTIYAGALFRDNQLSDDYEKLFSQSEGVIFFGGPDMPPGVYGEKTNLLTSVYDPYRHYFELSFLYHLLGGSQDPEYAGLLERNPDYLIYGFCLGMQTMNVATGGTMIQDIPTEVYGLGHAEDILKLDNDRLHRNYNRAISMDPDLLSGHFHRVHFKDSDYSKRLGLEDFHPVVYSNHHQAVEETGKGWQLMASSMDGKIVEGLRHEVYPNVIGVQFHPEAYFLYDSTTSYRIGARDERSFTGVAMLRKTNSMDFHRAFWSDFERRLFKRP